MGEKRRFALIWDNFHLLVGAFVINVFGLLYHFYLGRVLGPEDYGVLAVLVTLMGLIGIPYSTLQLSISKFVTSLHTAKKHANLAYLYKASLKKLHKIFFICFILFLGVNVFLSSFLKIPYLLLFFTSLLILLTPSISVLRGYLQGVQDFKSLANSLSFEGLSKFGFAALFVFLGFSVGGAVWGIIISYIVVILYSWLKTKKYHHVEAERFNMQEFKPYTFYVFYTFLLFISFYSLDLLIVKHFFSETDAGLYSALALVGRIVFFASFSVVQVMFPKVVALSEQQQSSKKVLLQSLWVILAISVPVLIVYVFFNELIVSLLFGASYISIAYLIAQYGLFMTFVSVAKLFSLYLLSIKKYAFLILLLIMNILEVVLLFMFHNSLAQVVMILLVLGAIFCGSTGYMAFRGAKHV